MSRAWVRALARRWFPVPTSPFRKSRRVGEKPRRENLRLETLEDRVVLTLSAPPVHLLPTGPAPLAVALPDLDADGRADFAALNADGSLTVALNAGDDTWAAAATTPLGITDPTGFAFGFVDQDLFTDLVVQTPTGLLVGRGDGAGRFVNLTLLSIDAGGALAAPAGARVEPAVAHLADGDTFADLVTVAPGADQVVVLRGTGFGGFAAPVRFASGGDQPVSVAVAQLIGDAVPDLAVGHRDGTVTFFRGSADGTFTPRPDLTVGGLGVVTGIAAADVDGNGETDLVVSGTDRVTVLHNSTDPAPDPVIANGDFAQGLSRWTVTSGTVTAGGGYAEFREDPAALLSTIRQSFVVPAGAQKLVFDLAAYGLEDPAGGLPDAFEASLLGPDDASLVPTFQPDASSFFALNPGNTVGLGTATQFDGRRVTVDLAGVAPGTAATIVFHLAGNPAGRTSVIGIDNVSLDPVIVVDERFIATPLEGPFDGARGVAVADVDGDGDGALDVVVADTTRLVVFNGDGVGGFVRDTVPVGGTGATAVAAAPLTAGDAIADVAVALGGSNQAATPLTAPVAVIAQGTRIESVSAPSGVEGSVVALTALFSGAAGGSFTATVDWGDGATSTNVPVTFANGQGTVTATHTYADNGFYPVRVTVRAADGTSVDFRDTTATITNAAPVVSTQAVLLDVNSDAEVTVGSFTDPGFTLPDFRTRETFLASINWGDGTVHPFGRVRLTDGGEGVLTAGTVFGTHRYAATGSYTAYLTVKDDDGGETTVPFTVTVRSNPVFGTVPNVAANEGEEVSFTATFTDPTPRDSWTAEIEWGDGTASLGVIGTGANGERTISSTHVYADNGTYTVRVRLADRAAHIATATATAAVANVAPALSVVANQAVRTDRPLAITVGTFSDPGFTFDPDGSGPHPGTHETLTATIDWDDGDGPQPGVVSPTSGAGTTGAISGSNTYHAPGTYTVTVTLRDDDGGEVARTFTVVVTAEAPEITSIDAVTGTEGQAALLRATFAAPALDGPYTATINWGDGTTGPGNISIGSGGEGVVTAARAYADNGAYPVTLTLVNRFGLAATATAVATITNVPPTYLPADDQTVGVNVPLVLSLGAFFDPGTTFDPDGTGPHPGTRETFTATVNWGNGSTPEGAAVTIVSASPTTVGLLRAPNPFDAPGTYTVTVLVADDDGGTATGSFTVTVLAHAPVVTAASAPSGAEGGSLQYTATFTDVDHGDDHTAVIDWGDGTTGPGHVSYDAAGVGTVTGSHVYADDAPYTVTLTVTDRFGLPATRTSSAVVSNVAPTVTPAADQSVTHGQALVLTAATFSDPGFTFDPDGSGPHPGTQESFLATITWGDGTATDTVVPSVTNGSPGQLTTGAVPGTHTYAAPGTYTVSVSVTDHDGAPTVRTFTVVVTASGPKFFVPDQSAHATYRYDASGGSLGSHPAAHGNSRPRGIAANAAGSVLWVIDAKKDVFVYTAAGAPLGQWAAGGINQPQDIATDGTHVWIVDDAQNRVHFYANAAARRAGAQNPTSNFALAADNTNPSGMVVRDGKLWVTDDRPNNQNDRVFVYTTGGQLLGSWELDPANRDSAGITLDPAGGGSLWVVDRQDSRVYHYANATGWTSGAHTASDSFALSGANHHAEGIADPAPTGWADLPAPAAAHTAPSGIDFGALVDVTPLAQLEYRTTYYNWHDRELRAEARLTNLSAPRLTAPVVAVFDPITPPVSLASRDGLTPAGAGYVGFGTVEMTADGLASGESSSFVGLRFAARPEVRFAFDVTLLSPANRAPTFTTTPGGVVNVGETFTYPVDAVDPDGDPLSFSLVTGPAGMSINQATGAVSWTSAAADLGTHAIVVSVSDGRGGGANQPFDLTVRAAGNRAPVIRSTPTTTAVRAGETFSYPVDAIDPDGDPLTYSIVGGPPGLQITADGLLTWPTGTTPGDYPVAFTVTDGRGGEASQGFVVTVTSAAPGSIEGIKFRFFDGNGTGISLAGPNLVTNGDFSQGNTGFTNEFVYQSNLFPERTYFVGTNPRNHHGAATSFGDHTTGTGLMLILNGATLGNRTVWEQTVTVESDTAYAFNLWAASWHPAAPAKLHITINGVQIGPNLQLPSTTALWTPFAVTWLSGAQTSAHIRIVNLETAAGGNDFVIDDIALGIPGVPNWTVYLDQNGNNKLDTGERSTVTAADGSYSFTGLAPGAYRVNEVQRVGWVQVAPATRTHVVTVGPGGTVTGVDFGNRQVAPTTNRAPQFGNTAPTAATVGQFYRFDPIVTDPDGEAVQFELVNTPPGMTVDRDTGTVTWVPAFDQVGTFTGTLRARDGAGAIANLPLSITVSAPAQGFAITSTPTRFITVGDNYAYAVTTIAPASQPAVFTLTDAPTGMRIDPVSGVLTWPAAAAGSHRVTIRANDRVGNEAFQSFVLAVRPVNAPPVITLPPNHEVTAGGTYRERVVAADTADGFRFSLAPGAPAGLGIDPVTGVLLWDTPTTALGDYTFTIRATDDRGAVGTAEFTITVLPDTTRPDVAVVVDDTTVDPGTPVAVTVVATDDAGVVDLTLTVNGVEVPLTAGAATFTPPAPGVYELTATATDAAGNTETTTVRLRVTDPNDNERPVITLASPQQGALVTYLTDLVGTITDANLDTYRVEISRAGTNQWRLLAAGTAANASGVLAVIDPTLLDNDQYTVRVTATDINGLTEVAELAIELDGQAKVGNFRQEFVDLQVPLAGIPVTITRVYDTLQADKAGDFGFGWSLGVGYDPRPRETVAYNPAESILGMFAAVPFKAGTRVYVTTPDGRRVGFTFEPKPYDGIIGALGGPTGGMYKPYFKPDPGVFETLAGEYDGGGAFQLPLIKVGNNYHLAAIGVPYNPLGYKLTTKDGLVYHFGQTSGLQSITDRNGVKLTFTRNGVTSSLGTSITFVRDAQGRIEKIIDPAGKPITYTYDANGDLTGVTDQVGTKSRYDYAPDRAHYLIDINNATGACGCFTSVPPMRMEYDENGRLKLTADQLGNATLYSYNLDANTEVIRDALNEPTTYVFDDRGNVLSVTDPLNHTKTYTYDADDNLLTDTDANDHTVTYTYDARGNLTSITDALDHTSTVEYNALNKATLIIDAEGNAFTYEYDPRGNLVRILSPALSGGSGFSLLAAESLATEFTYDTQGRTRTVSDARGGTTAFAYANGFDLPVAVFQPDGSAAYTVYDFLGRMESTEDENGNVTTYDWDDSGRLLRTTDSEGGFVAFTYEGHKVKTASDSLGRTVSIDYDEADRRTRVTDAEGHTTVTEYDGNGDVLRVTDGRNTTTTYTYRADRRLHTLTTPEGGVTVYDYDPAGNVVSYTDANDHTTTYEYDDADRMISMTAADTGETTYTYDAVGNLLTVTDPLDRTSFYDYDSYNRLISMTDPENGFTSYTYDEAGNLTAVVDPNGHETNYAYDLRGRALSMSDALDQTVHFFYDGVGNVTSVIDRLGRLTSYTYDGRNRVLTWTDARGEVREYTYDTEGQLTEMIDERNHATAYEYDRVGRLEKVTDARDGVTEFGYDENGNLTEVTDANDHTTTYAYDGDNRRISRTDARNGVIAYGYDPVGNLVSYTDAHDHTTMLTYDEVDQLLTVTDPLQHVTAYEYDLVGNLVSHTDANDHTTTYEYDGLDRLLTITDARNGVTAYGYDAAGNHTSFTDANDHTETYEYDELNRLISITDAADGVIVLGYDAVGNRTSFTDANDHTTTYEYDELNRLVAQTDPAGKVWRMTYDATGNLCTYTDPLTHSATFAYDELNRLVTHTAPDTGETTYTYDAVGNLLTITDPLDRTTTYAHDELDRLVSVTDPRSSVTAYSYDAVGNLLSLTDPNLNTTTFEYDDADRLIQETDERDKSRFYEYDPVGNLTAATDRNGRRREFGYDELNRNVSEVWKGAGGADVYTATQTYDAVGNLLTASDGVSSYTLDYDALDRLTRVDNQGTPNAPHAVFDYSYDAAGNLLRVEDNFGIYVDSDYDARDSLTGLTWGGGGIAPARVEMGYDDAARRVSVDRYRDLSGTQLVARTVEGYDAVGRLTQRTTTDAGGSTIVDYRYTFDLTGQVTAESHHGQSATYSYDLAGQLLTADRTGQPDETYAYDAGGNHIADGQTVDAANRITSDAVYDYGYDDEGNVVSKTERSTGEVTTFAYDYRNRLVEVTRTAAGGSVLMHAEYEYDVFDRLVAREVDGNRVVTVYNGSEPWADFDSLGAAVARYLYGEGDDEILARWRPGDGQAWYLGDKQGSVRDVIDALGAVIGQRDYDGFGAVLAAAGAVDRFAFQGREWEEAVGLYQFRARWYDPVLRQFTSEDPLGFAAGDANLRRFVFNDPLRFTDPTGMTVATEYSIRAHAGATIGGAAAGFVLGFLCGYLDSLAGGDPFETAMQKGWEAGKQGAVFGALLGAVGYLAPYTVFGFGLGFGNYAGVQWIAEKGTVGQKIVRIGCLVAGNVLGYYGYKNLRPGPRIFGKQGPPSQPKPPQPTPPNNRRIPLPMLDDGPMCFPAGTDVLVAETVTTAEAGWLDWLDWETALGLLLIAAGVGWHLRNRGLQRERDLKSDRRRDGLLGSQLDWWLFPTTGGTDEPIAE